ncbi:MAG: hypothetical protein GDA43_07820 [Hormoscilla sp. SP5CHS1]|nr:hypothetical protein [Hormoscilla sp. SP12CHS1]MBC6453129.1 hypothetical protein [Hormoscilla sp. SP5CHS1]
MSQTLVLHLSDEAYTLIQQQAEAANLSPSQLAVTWVSQLAVRQVEQHRLNLNLGRSEAEKQAARERFESHFGEIDLGYPTEADNESIDADIAREYADNH